MTDGQKTALLELSTDQRLTIDERKSAWLARSKLAPDAECATLVAHLTAVADERWPATRGKEQ